MRCLTRDLDSKKKDNAEFSKFKINRDVLPTVFNNIYSTWNLCLRGHKNVRVMGFATVRTDSDEVPLVLKLSRTFQHDAKGLYLNIQYSIRPQIPSHLLQERFCEQVRLRVKV